MPSLSAKPHNPNDIVQVRAREMRINAQELFARAFADAGLERSKSMAPYINYCTRKGGFVIPEIVRAFCEKPMPTCESKDCPTPTKFARISRTDLAGRTSYFCSMDCREATPIEVTETIQMTDTRNGLEILERVQRAMADAVFIKVDPKAVRPMVGQPRIYFNVEMMRRLLDSIKTVGQLTPGIIRKTPENSEGHIYEVLDGERRWRSVLEAEIPQYRAMLVDIDDEAAPYVVSVIANFNRAEHTVLESVDAVVKMHEGLKLTMYQIADTLGLSSYIEASKLYGLKRLIPEVRALMDPALVKGHPLAKTAAIYISQVAPNGQLALALRLMEKDLTVAKLKAEVRTSAGHAGNLSSRRRATTPEARLKYVEIRVESSGQATTELATIVSEPETKNALSDLSHEELTVYVSGITDSISRLESVREVLRNLLKN